MSEQGKSSSTSSTNVVFPEPPKVVEFDESALEEDDLSLRVKLMSYNQITSTLLVLFISFVAMALASLGPWKGNDEKDAKFYAGFILILLFFFLPYMYGGHHVQNPFLRSLLLIIHLMPAYIGSIGIGLVLLSRSKGGECSLTSQRTLFDNCNPGAKSQHLPHIPEIFSEICPLIFQLIFKHDKWTVGVSYCILYGFVIASIAVSDSITSIAPVCFVGCLVAVMLSAGESSMSQNLTFMKKMMRAKHKKQIKGKVRFNNDVTYSSYPTRGYDEVPKDEDNTDIKVSYSGKESDDDCSSSGEAHNDAYSSATTPSPAFGLELENLGRMVHHHYPPPPQCGDDIESAISKNTANLQEMKLSCRSNDSIDVSELSTNHNVLEQTINHDQKCNDSPNKRNDKQRKGNLEKHKSTEVVCTDQSKVVGIQEKKIWIHDKVTSTVSSTNENGSTQPHSFNPNPNPTPNAYPNQSTQSLYFIRTDTSSHSSVSKSSSHSYLHAQSESKMYHVQTHTKPNDITIQSTIPQPQTNQSHLPSNQKILGTSNDDFSIDSKASGYNSLESAAMPIRPRSPLWAITQKKEFSKFENPLYAHPYKNNCNDQESANYINDNPADTVDILMSKTSTSTFNLQATFKVIAAEKLDLKRMKGNHFEPIQIGDEQFAILSEQSKDSVMNDETTSVMTDVYLTDPVAFGTDAADQVSVCDSYNSALEFNSLYSSDSVNVYYEQMRTDMDKKCVENKCNNTPVTPVMSQEQQLAYIRGLAIAAITGFQPIDRKTGNNPLYGNAYRASQVTTEVAVLEDFSVEHVLLTYHQLKNSPSSQYSYNIIAHIMQQLMGRAVQLQVDREILDHVISFLYSRLSKSF